jgi:hypothetical protein
MSSATNRKRTEPVDALDKKAEVAAASLSEAEVAELGQWLYRMDQLQSFIDAAAEERQLKEEPR